jgi:hypothetical protein
MIVHRGILDLGSREALRRMAAVLSLLTESYSGECGRVVREMAVSAYMRKVTGSLRSESFAKVKSSRLSLSMMGLIDK